MDAARSTAAGNLCLRLHTDQAGRPWRDITTISFLVINTGLYMILISDQYIFLFRILMCFFCYTSGGRSISKQEAAIAQCSFLIERKAIPYQQLSCFLTVEWLLSSPYRSSILEPLPLILYFRHSKHIGKFPVEREEGLVKDFQELVGGNWSKEREEPGKVRKKRRNTRNSPINPSLWSNSIFSAP